MNRLSVSGGGLAVAGGAVLGYGGGVLLGYPVLIRLAVGMLAMLCCAAAAVVIRPSVTMSRRLTPDRVTVGESAQGRLEIRNSPRWPAPGFTAVDRVGTESIELAVTAMAPGATRTVSYAVRASRRGRLRLGPLTVRRRDPLGLFTWAQRQTGDGVLWAHPAVYRMRALPFGVLPDHQDLSTGDTRAGTVTFSSLRAYTPGDDPRRIHWRSTARLGTLVVREHVDTHEPATSVVLDTRPAALDADAFEEAVAVAASVLRAVEQIGRPAALHIVGERPDHVARDGAESTMDRLALAHRLAEDDPLRLLATIDRVAAGGALVVVTGNADAGMLDRLAEQRRRFEPVVVVCLSRSASTPTARRRRGFTVLTARTAAEVAAEWNLTLPGGTA